MQRQETRTGTGDCEIFGIIGPIGPGKTTTVECLQGLRETRWIRAGRGGQVVGNDVVILELVAMAFTVASPLAQALDGQLWNAVVAIGIGVVLAGWGVLTRVRRRAGFGAGTVIVAVLLLIGVPLSDLGAWRGPALWVTVIAIGLTAVLVATTLERGRGRLEQIRHRLDDMTEGWERIGRPPPARPSQCLCHGVGMSGLARRPWVR